MNISTFLTDKRRIPFRIPRKWEIDPKFLSLTTFSTVLLFMFLVRIFEVPGVLRSFFGAFFYYLLPFSLGHMVSIAMPFSPIARISIRTVFEWMLGTASLFIISLLLDLSGLFSLTSLYLMYCLFFFIYFLRVRKIHYVYRLDLNSFLVPIIFGITSFLLIRLKSPFPFAPDWDGFVFGFVANRIRLHNEFHLLQRDYSTTIFRVNEITRPHNLLLALSTFLVNSEVVEVNWWGVLYNYLIYFLSMDILMRKLFQKPSLLHRLILSTAIFFTEYHIAGALMFFSPATMISLLFIFGLISYIEGFKGQRKRRLITETICTFAFYLLWHFFIGLLYFIIILAFLVLEILAGKSRGGYGRYLKIILTLLFSVSALGSLISMNTAITIHLDFTLLSNFFGSPLTILRITEKLYHLYTYYTIPLVYFSIFSALVSLYLFYAGGDETRHIFTLNLLFMGLFFTFCAVTAPLIHRLVYLFKIFIPLSIGTLTFLSRKSTSRISIPLSGRKFPLNKIISISTFTLIVVIITSSSIPNYVRFMGKYPAIGDYDIFSSYTEYDLKMGLWIRKNVAEDLLLLGEPNDQHILSGLSALNNLGGHFMRASNRELLRAFFKAENESEALSLLEELMRKNNLTRTRVIIIISGRTAHWLMGDVEIAYHPYLFRMSKEYHKFFNSNTFHIIHQEGNEIYAFVIRDSDS